MCLKLFRAYSRYIRHDTFSFMMSLPAMSLGLRFGVSRKGGTGGGGWVHTKGANSMAASGLVFRSNLVGTGRVISILFGINGVRNQRSHLVGPPFQEFKVRFSATPGWHFSRDLTRCLLIGRCGQSYVSAKHGWNYLWEQFWALQAERTETGVRLRVVERENDLEKKI